MKKILVLLPLTCLLSQSVAMDRSHRMAMGKSRGRAAPVCYDKAPDRLMLTGDPRLEPSAEFTGGFSVTDDLGTKTLAVALSAALLFAPVAAYASDRAPKSGAGDLMELQKAHEVDAVALTRNSTDWAYFEQFGRSCCCKNFKCVCFHPASSALLKHVLKTSKLLNRKTRWCAFDDGRCDREKMCKDNLYYMMSKADAATKTLKKLIKCGATVDERSDTGMTALMAAARGGFSSFVHKLLKAGADPALVDDKNLTALDYALLYGLEAPFGDEHEAWEATHPFRCPGRHLCAKMLIKKMGWEQKMIAARLDKLLDRLYPPSLYPDSELFPGYSTTNRDCKKWYREMALESLFSGKEHCAGDGCSH